MSIDTTTLVTSSSNPLSTNFREEPICVSLVDTSDNEDCDDGLLLDGRIIDTRAEVDIDDESEASQNENVLPAIGTTPVRSIRARQFFPSSSQTKKNTPTKFESASVLRAK